MSEAIVLMGVGVPLIAAALTALTILITHLGD